jgi:16S rRNA C1402 (ribose-2'-O) methylase RsmI
VGDIPARGEIVVIVAGRAPGAAGDAEAAPSLEDARAQVAALVRAGASRTDAARRVAEATGHSRRDLYREGGTD